MIPMRVGKSNRITLSVALMTVLAVMPVIVLTASAFSTSLFGPDPEVYQACVDEDGEIRLIGDQFNLPDEDEDDKDKDIG